MFQCCVLFLDVVLKDAEASLRQVVVLPFIPSAGQILMLGSVANDELFEFEAHRVEYVVPNSEFWLFGASHDNSCPCVPADGCCTWSGNESYYTDAGWEITAVRRGYERHHTFDWMFEPEKNFLTAPRDE